MKLSELLGDPSWLFDLGFPIQQLSGPISHAAQLEWRLDDAFQIPALSTLSGEKRFAEMCVAWNADGLFIHAVLRSAVGRSATSSGSTAKNSLLTVYLDTRWSPGVHRATSYCHRFDFILALPTKSQPFVRGHGELSPIQRARSAPAEIHPKDISAGTFFQPGGYEIKAFLKGSTLTGYDPDEFQEIGIFYTINDPVFGNQSIARTRQSPYFEDPSVWCRGKLVNSPS